MKWLLPRRCPFQPPHPSAFEDLHLRVNSSTIGSTAALTNTEVSEPTVELFAVAQGCCGDRSPRLDGDHER
jgi:hypothetical protein